MSFLFGMTSQNRGFSRNSIATYYNSAGLRKIAGMNVPRINYNPTTLSLEGPLFERAPATNLMQYSNDFTKSRWIKSGLTITANSGIGASGDMDMSRFVQNTNAPTIYQYVTVVPGSTYTLSVDVKKDVGDWLFLNMLQNNPFTHQVMIWYDLANKVVGSSKTLGSAIIHNISSKTLPNNIIRIAITASFSNSTSVAFQTSIVSGDNGTALSPASYYMGCVQMETGILETSYIPTLDSIGIRAPDIGG